MYGSSPSERSPHRFASRCPQRLHGRMGRAVSRGDTSIVRFCNSDANESIKRRNRRPRSGLRTGRVGYTPTGARLRCRCQEIVRDQGVPPPDVGSSAASVRQNSCEFAHNGLTWTGHPGRRFRPTPGPWGVWEQSFIVLARRLRTRQSGACSARVSSEKAWRGFSQTNPKPVVRPKHCNPKHCGPTEWMR